MLKSHKNFYSVNGKRLVLVVDDEAINREMLGYMIADSYEVFFAENGLQALQIIREKAKLLSLILLDLKMPELSGTELLKILKEDESLHHIPVIVLTSETTAEVESLRLGAADFIHKPYGAPEVIRARIRRTIELSEDSYIIQTTEQDELTGLYNKEFFFRYAEQFDRYHPQLSTDAVFVDVNHFHLINELFGRKYGNELLQEVAKLILDNLGEKSIACRREADKFLIYCPHREDYEDFLERVVSGLTLQSKSTRIRLRMGVYPNGDKSIEVERRFDRAKIAGDTIRNNYSKSVAYYDNSLHEKEIFQERLLDEIDDALSTGQFEVYYQPKYNIQGQQPVLASAEALIRWKHPKFGRISPGVFIPLLEENGLIQKLDHFVWESVARQMRLWREKYHLTIPVSVNVSRVDLYDPNLPAIFQQLIRENGLSPSDFLLEITESAYTEDSDQIVQLVETLRSQGFRIEMDDFGSGYSSLNLLATLPVDALKLDKAFIKNIENGQKTVHFIKLIVDIARYLSVPVIAEGVEKEEQMRILKEVGCDIVQGYYFSRPVLADAFEFFIEKRVKEC